MRKLYLIFLFFMFVFSAHAYEFNVSALTTPIGKAAPKQVLVRKKAAAVIFLKTNIAQLTDMSDSTIEQAKTSDGYVLYVAPDWPGSLYLTAPGFSPKQVEIGKLPPGAVRQMEVTAQGKDSQSFKLSSARLSFAVDTANATAAVSQTYAPEIWINTDASFQQIQPLLKEGGYTLINDTRPPYRISPKKKKAKAADVLSPQALSLLGDISKLPLEERTVYNLDVLW